MLDGNITEEHYDWPSESDGENKMVKDGTSSYDVNEVTYICGMFDFNMYVVGLRLTIWEALLEFIVYKYFMCIWSSVTAVVT